EALVEAGWPGSGQGTTLVAERILAPDRGVLGGGVDGDVDAALRVVGQPGHAGRGAHRDGQSGLGVVADGGLGAGRARVAEFLARQVERLAGRVALDQAVAVDVIGVASGGAVVGARGYVALSVPGQRLRAAAAVGAGGGVADLVIGVAGGAGSRVVSGGDGRRGVRLRGPGRGHRVGGRPHPSAGVVLDLAGAGAGGVVGPVSPVGGRAAEGVDARGRGAVTARRSPGGYQPVQVVVLEALAVPGN